jgi:hypothetical protein
VANTSCLSLVGSVTPEGRVFLTFTPTTLKPETTVTQGFGEMRISKGQWTMEPQMSARSTARLQVIHWAYMIQCRPHEPSCQALHGVGVSIDTLLRDCPGAPHLQQNGVSSSLSQSTSPASFDPIIFLVMPNTIVDFRGRCSVAMRLRPNHALNRTHRNSVVHPARKTTPLLARLRGIRC